VELISPTLLDLSSLIPFFQTRLSTGAGIYIRISQVVFYASKEERRPENSIKSTMLSLCRFKLPKTPRTILRMTNNCSDIPGESLKTFLVHT